MACRNLCNRLCSKIIVGKSNYAAAKKYCRRCEIYLFHKGSFCPCCGIALRVSPTARKDKEKLRQPLQRFKCPITTKTSWIYERSDLVKWVEQFRHFGWQV